jgi:hypothetical protein
MIMISKTRYEEFLKLSHIHKQQQQWIKRVIRDAELKISSAVDI